MNNITVKGNLVDNETRCIHYHSSLDVIAIKFKCCNDYYSCYHCHEEQTSHAAQVWKKDEFETPAVLCGKCKHEMTISQYLNSANKCPSCNAKFNPGCKNHYHFYFEQ